MRLSGTNELIAIAVVILVTCFYPQLAHTFVRSHGGKAVALAATAWVALHVSQPLALFLAVLIVSCCSGSMEYVCDPSLVEAPCKKAGGMYDKETKKCKCSE